ncbi:TetR family transcriptional regulator [Amycolatopsis endophytica]|uniref:AcrR family transcriptional regulator n=1 Tax=Amycolatopsis endophytica TaxID=860233 RepID=A0A853B0P5_9PSEU|nr:TetR family transcriptional regulator [Amycolatopsis endophytica]NYI88286.1 AcrR family transcriptional regulator [Amycolatopsis endophytica]
MATREDRRTGAETRAEILRVALRLFTERGYEGTSTRDISTALGITKSALYYHFPSKESIVTSLLTERRRELDDLVEWIRTQPASPDLVQRAALRWIDGATSERLDGMRLMHANGPVLRNLLDDGNDVRSHFERIVDALVAADATPADRLYVRMAFDTVGAALLSAQRTDASLEDILAAARRATLALTA